jgi:hypothetical protein
MNKTFDLDKKLKELTKQIGTSEKKLRSGVIRNAKTACAAMEEAAKEHTPNSNDGKQRGFNVISDSLRNSWIAEYIKSRKRGEIGTVTLSNSKPYAPFVQYGHKVSRHFVPWLYIDGNVLSYETNHNQPLFGLIVGTKTKYVKGVDMITPAIEAFNKTFDELNKRLLDKLMN